MVDAILLWAALTGAVNTATGADEFALRVDAGRFPPAAHCENAEALARERLGWLQARQWMDCDLWPGIHDECVKQWLVVESYELLRYARDP